MPNPVFPELIQEAIGVASASLLGLPCTEEVRICTKILIIKHIIDKIAISYEELISMVDIDVFPAEDDPTRFRVRVRAHKEEKANARPKRRKSNSKS